MAWGLLDPEDAYHALWDSLEDALAGQLVEVDLAPDVELACRLDLADITDGMDGDDTYNCAEPYDDQLFFTLLLAAAWRHKKIFWQHISWDPEHGVSLCVSCADDGGSRQLRLPGL